MSAKGQGLSLQDMIEEYLEYLMIERQVSPYTIRNYRFYLNKFKDWLRKYYPSENLETATPRILKQYRAYLAKTKASNGKYLSPVTQGYYVIALRSFLKYLIRNDYEVVPPERLELPRGKEHSLKFLDYTRIEAMLEKAQ